MELGEADQVTWKPHSAVIKAQALGSDVWSLGPSLSSPDLGINVSHFAALLPAETPP